MNLKLLPFFLLLSLITIGQHSKDTLNLAQHFSKGHIHGHFRNFTMATVNNRALKDYWTNASGMALAYESISYYGFSMNVKGIFTFKTISTDLNEVDSLVGKASKWERELYDVLDPHNENDMDRLEALNIKYENENGFLSYGKMGINNTPLVNVRDGRMKPYAFQGFNGELKLDSVHKFHGIFLHGVTPRGTTEWFSLKNGIGINNNGFAENGTKANYIDATSTWGLFSLGYKIDYNKVKFHFWNFYLDQYLGLNWAQLEWNSKNWKLGVINLLEKGHPSQGNLEIENQYINPNHTTGAFSSIIKRKIGLFGISLSHTSLYGNGRFVFPRELGRERLYTSIPRSWAEGLGKSHISNIGFEFKKKTLKIDLVSTYYNVPGTTNFKYNKYGVRDYWQTNLLVDFQFTNWMKGADLMFLYVYRKDIDSSEITLNDQFNKTDFHQLNLILNVNF